MEATTTQELCVASDKRYGLKDSRLKSANINASLPRTAVHQTWTSKAEPVNFASHAYTIDRERSDFPPLNLNLDSHVLA